MLPTELEYHFTGVECFLQGWNAFYRVRTFSTEFESPCTELECLLGGWNAFDRVGIPLYRVGITFYNVGMLSRGLECFRQSWYTFVQGSNAF
jgi:hypothetical protein